MLHYTITVFYVHKDISNPNLRELVYEHYTIAVFYVHQDISNPNLRKIVYEHYTIVVFSLGYFKS